MKLTSLHFILFSVGIVGTAIFLALFSSTSRSGRKSLFQEENTTKVKMQTLSGLPVPPIGYGVFRMDPGAATRDAISTAISIGYRHIDTAKLYGNEAEVGEAIRLSGLPRGEFFVTTKIWNDDQGYDRTIAAAKESRDRLGIGPIDLLILHAPVVGKRLDSYRALVELQKLGVTRFIGVSNYGIQHLEEIRVQGLPTPACNQIELHPFLQRRELVAYCERQGIALVAYSPLAKAKALGDAKVVEVATRLGVTPAQVMLRWGLQKGFVVLPKSTRAERQRENLDLRVEIPTHEMEVLDSLESGLVTGWDPTVWK